MLRWLLKNKLFFLALNCLSLIFSGCTDTFVGEYSDPAAAEIVDDRWNETDARKSGEILINSMLKKPWLRQFKMANDAKRPAVLVDEIGNRTDEHIDTKALGEAVRNEILNSGEVRFVNVEGRGKIVNELKYQNKSGMVSPTSAKQKGKQLGADFMLTGSISSSVHTQKGLKTVTYQILMQLTSFETAEIVWSEKYDIKKRFNRSGHGW